MPWWCWWWPAMMYLDGSPHAELAHLPPPQPRTAPAHRRHVLDPERHRPPRSPCDLEQIERTCRACYAVKVTIIGKDNNHRRAWRRCEEAAQMETFAGLACEPVFGVRA